MYLLRRFPSNTYELINAVLIYLLRVKLRLAKLDYNFNHGKRVIYYVCKILSMPNAFSQ